MDCGCGGGSTASQPWAPNGATPPAPDADVPVSTTYPFVPVHLRPGRQGVPIPEWLPVPTPSESG